MNNIDSIASELEKILKSQRLKTLDLGKMIQVGAVKIKKQQNVNRSSRGRRSV